MAVDSVCRASPSHPCARRYTVASGTAPNYLLRIFRHIAKLAAGPRGSSQPSGMARHDREGARFGAEEGEATEPFTTPSSLSEYRVRRLARPCVGIIGS